MDNRKSENSNLNTVRDFFLSLVKSEDDKEIIKYLYTDEDMDLVLKKLIDKKNKINHD